MRNKNMMIMGIVMVLCQFIVLGAFGLVFAYDAGSTIMIPSDTATMIVSVTFLILINIAAVVFISYGASDE